MADRLSGSPSPPYWRTQLGEAGGKEEVWGYPQQALGDSDSGGSGRLRLGGALGGLRGGSYFYTAIFWYHGCDGIGIHPILRILGLNANVGSSPITHNIFVPIFTNESRSD